MKLLNVNLNSRHSDFIKSFIFKQKLIIFTRLSVIVMGRVPSTRPCSFFHPECWYVSIRIFSQADGSGFVASDTFSSCISFAKVCAFELSGWLPTQYGKRWLIMLAERSPREVRDPIIMHCWRYILVIIICGRVMTDSQARTSWERIVRPYRSFEVTMDHRGSALRNLLGWERFHVQQIWVELDQRWRMRHGSYWLSSAYVCYNWGMVLVVRRRLISSC